MKIEPVIVLLRGGWVFMYRITIFTTIVYINGGPEFFYNNCPCDILLDSQKRIWVFTEHEYKMLEAVV